MFYKDESNSNWVIDTEGGQRLELSSGDNLSFNVLDSVLDAQNAWFAAMLRGTNPETTLRSMEFSPEGIDVGYQIDYCLKYRNRVGHALTDNVMAIAERKSRQVIHKLLPFRAPGLMLTKYFYLNISVIEQRTRRELEQYQAIFNPASYVLFATQGVCRGTGAYGEPMLDEVFVQKAAV